MAVSKKKKRTLVVVLLIVAGLVYKFKWNYGNGVKLTTKPASLPWGFSGAGYLKFNPDVAGNSMYANDPGKHYLDYGWAEGRKWA